MVGRRPVLGQVVVPVCATTGSAQCLVRLWILAPFYQGGLWKNLYDFLREGVDSDPEVNSRRFSPCSHAEDEVPRSSSTTSVACFLAGFAGFLHPALCSRCCRHDGMHTVRSVHCRCFSYLSCTWKSVHYFYDPCVFSAFFCSRNFALVDFLGPSSIHSVKCLRAGGAGVAGSLLPGDSAPGPCQFMTTVLWIYTHL